MATMLNIAVLVVKFNLANMYTILVLKAFSTSNLYLKKLTNRGFYFNRYFSRKSESKKTVTKIILNCFLCAYETSVNSLYYYVYEASIREQLLNV